ncbi:hypothetical protein D3C76_1074660 [compost metagenome]
MHNSALATFCHNLGLTFWQTVISSLHNCEWYRFCFLYILFGYANNPNIEIRFNGTFYSRSYFIVLAERYVKLINYLLHVLLRCKMGLRGPIHTHCNRYCTYNHNTIPVFERTGQWSGHFIVRFQYDRLFIQNLIDQRMAGLNILSFPVNNQVNIFLVLTI